VGGARLENLPAKLERVVIVSNHQSTLDMAVMSYLWRLPFRVVFKHELMWYPGLGTAMWLAGYPSVKRSDRTSGHALIEQCKAEIAAGHNVLFFAEGTRKAEAVDAAVGAFKPGAFKVATESGAAILPCTISGARRMFPAKGLPSFEYGRPRLVIHPLVSSAGKTVEKLMTEVHAIVTSGTRDVDLDGPATPATPATPDTPAAPAGAAGGGAATIDNSAKED